MVRHSNARKKRKSKRIRSRLLVAIDLAGRLGLIVGVLAASIFCIQTFRKLGFAEKREVVTVEDSTEAGIANLEELLNGDWQFVGMPWSIKISEHSDQLGEEELLATYSQPHDQIVRPLDEHDETVWGVVSLFESRRIELAHCVAYLIETQGWRVCCFARLTQPEQIHSILVQFDFDKEGCKRIDLVRKTDFTDKNQDLLDRFSVLSGLQGNRIALRRDSAGEICAELFETIESDDNLVKIWQESDWKVSSDSSVLDFSFPHVPQSSPVDVGAGEPVEQVFVLKREEESVCVVLSKISSSGTRTLLWLRLSS